LPTPLVLCLRRDLAAIVGVADLNTAVALSHTRIEQLFGRDIVEAIENPTKAARAKVASTIDDVMRDQAKKLFGSLPQERRTAIEQLVPTTRNFNSTSPTRLT